jgi:hypothetical protein
VRRIGGSLLLSAVCPWIAYQFLISRGAGVVLALAVSALFPLVGTVVGRVRLGRPDVLGALSVLFVGVSLAAALVTDDALVILLRPAVSSAIFAVLCVGSLALGRPLMFYVARQYVAGWDRAAFERFGVQWEQPGFGRSMRRLTLAWGCWFAIQAVGRAAGAVLLEVPTLLAVWPFVTNVGTVAMILWSVKGSRPGAGARGLDQGEDGARLNEAARQALLRAAEEAKRLRQPSVGTEHLLVALCEDQAVAARVLRTLSVTRETACATLETIVGSGNAPAWQEPEPDAGLRAALGRATEAQRAAAADEIGTEHLLIGLLDERDGQAAQLLVYMGVDLAALRDRLVRMEIPAPGAEPELPTVAVDGGS